MGLTVNVQATAAADQFQYHSSVSNFREKITCFLGLLRIVSILACASCISKWIYINASFVFYIWTMTGFACISLYIYRDLSVCYM